MFDNFENIPSEMKSFRQWVLWRYEDINAAKPTKVPYSISGKLASVTNSETWSNFDECVSLIRKGSNYNGLGFVLTDEDPFAFIDLDDTKGDQAALDRQVKIYGEFDSYAERSPSGLGLHIIVKGSIPSGRRRSFVEIYSNERYMTMTGEIYRSKPIVECNDLLNSLWAQMGTGKAASVVYSGLDTQTEGDEAVIKKAEEAANGEKFAALFAGKWQDYYESQSEADFALVDIVAFYTQNKAQIARIFASSGLGKRDKAKRSDYVNYMLNKCFDRMLPPVDVEGLRNQLNEAISKKEKSAKKKPKDATSEKDVTPKREAYSLPPGLIGEIAQYIYNQAPRPVAEIALAGAIGLVAGIVGRAYNVSGTGLNQYVLLLAPTGTGKEAIASGIDKLMSAVIRTVPASVDFVGPGEIASAQALIKYMSKTANSFVSLVGEFGIYLQQMASVNAPPHLIGLRRMLLDLYNKSGEGKVLRPSIYSDREKNTTSVLAPSLTMLGESTPEKFYEGLHEGMISEGLLPRFTIIEYHGDRSPLNTAHAYAKPSFELIEKTSTLCAHSLMLNSQHKAIQVQFTKNAELTLDEFNVKCDGLINGSDREVRRQLWSRGHIKALKLAALVSVGCNPYEPTVDDDCAKWAIKIVVADIENLLTKFESGEIGADNEESKQLAKTVSTIRDFIVTSWSDVAKYAGANSAALHNNKIVPYAYIQRRLAAVAIFRKDRNGASIAIKRALTTLKERGDIVEMSKATLSKDYGTTCLAYAISNTEAFLH